MKKSLLFVCVLVGLGVVSLGCQPPEKAATEQPGATAKMAGQPAEPGSDPSSQPGEIAPLEAGKTNHYGAEFTLTEGVALASALNKAEELDGKTVRVTGDVAAVCKKKGCWFVIKTDEAEARTVRISMKDYGFFVPKDCDGKKAEVEGVLQKKTITEAVRKHLAEDGGEDPSKVVGDAVEIQLVATGVAIEG